MSRHDKIKADLLGIFEAGLQAVSPYNLILNHVRLEGNQLVIDVRNQVLRYDLNDFEQLYVLGCGKAAASLAKAVEEVLGDRITRGLICVKYGHTEVLRKIKQLQAGHPVPDINGVTAAVNLIDLAKTADETTLVINLITGGGSALLPAPAAGLSLEDKQATTRLLLGCGVDINGVNCVRKHLSQLKGGRLAQLLGDATVVNLIISDVAGNDLSTIASGLCAPDYTTYKDAVGILEYYGLADKVPPGVMAVLQKGVRGEISETPIEQDACFAKVHNVVLAGNGDCVRACAAKARSLGYDNTNVLSRFFTGEARDIGRSLYAMSVEMDQGIEPGGRPLCIVLGGEATVTLTPDHGKGGRATEVALAYLQQQSLRTHDNFYFLAGATDGNDGPTDAAGAVITPDLPDKVNLAKMDLSAYLNGHDAYTALERLGALLKTGPTNTNVCDVGVIVIA